MKRAIQLLVLVAASVCFAGENETDNPGSKDHPAVTRLPGFFIDDYDVKDFDAHAFHVGADGKEQSVEGKKYFFRYMRKQATKVMSPLQILRNYEQALKKAGGKVLYNQEGYVDGRLEQGKRAIWVSFYCGVDSDYQVVIVEPKEMEQEASMDARQLGDAITTTGKVAVYGIYFDSGKSVVKPESKPALEQIAAMLKADAALKVVVVGHTDNQGAHDGNMKLSQDRANAVVRELTGAYGIAAARLKASGVAALCPVATNRDEKGRALNRRVELVEQ